MMQWLVADDYLEMSKTAADLLNYQLQTKPDSVIGFATGSTPLGLYEELVQSNQQGETDFSKMTTFNLDEYVGVERDHPQSYYQFMWRHLFSRINVRPEAIHFPPGVFADAEQACEEYEQQMQDAGGIDLQILGVGRNGHIGFNEPGTAFKLETHIVELTADTRDANARFFDNPDEVPRHAITMGIQSIMNAKSILLLASGKSKAKAVRSLFGRAVDPAVPVTILQLHPNVILLIDKEAASLLTDVLHIDRQERRDG